MKGEHLLKREFATDVGVENKEWIRVFCEILSGEGEGTRCERWGGDGDGDGGNAKEVTLGVWVGVSKEFRVLGVM